MEHFQINGSIEYNAPSLELFSVISLLSFQSFKEA